MGLIEDFSTWTEKVRRKLSRESGDAGRQINEKLPPGVPVSVRESLVFIDSLVGLDPPEDIAEKAARWRGKLCRIPISKPAPNSRA
jgi:hypothetical protein